VSAVYSSAAPGTLALGAPGRGTLFSQALLECLDVLGTEPDDEGRWVVRDTSLVGPLKARVLELATEHGLEQTATAGGTLGPTVLHRLSSPPVLEVKFTVDPSEAAAVSFVSLSDEGGNATLQSQSLDPELAARLPAGLYTLEVAIDPDTPPYIAKRQPCFVRPPRPKPVVVTVT
jgi:hypothetical protein